MYKLSRWRLALSISMLVSTAAALSGTASASMQITHSTVAVQAVTADHSDDPDLTAPLTGSFAYYDEESTGAYFYNVYPKGSSTSYVIYTDPAGNWHRLPDTVGQLYETNQPGELPRIWLKVREQYDDYFTARYDIRHETIIYAQDYKRSPDGRWGMKELTTFTGVNPSSPEGKTVHLLLKNFATSKVVDWKQSNSILGADWLYDNTIVTRGSRLFPAKLGVVRHDPITGETTNMTDGYYPVVSADQKQVLFYRSVNNNAGSLLFVRDVASGKEHRVNDQIEYKQLMGQNSTRVIEAPSIPANLRLADLPVTPLKTKFEWEHDLVLDGKHIPIPYAILYQSQAYVPLRFLIDNGAVDAASASGKVTISHDGNSIQMNSSNSRQYGTRVYVQASLLRKLGYANVTVIPHRAAAQ